MTECGLPECRRRSEAMEAGGQRRRPALPPSLPWGPGISMLGAEEEKESNVT